MLDMSIRRQTTVVNLLSALRYDILFGTYSDNTMLSENQIAQQYGVSRSSVRTAFQMLENDGLMESLPNGRHRVRRVDAKYLSDFCSTRSILECEAVRLILQRCTTENIDFSALLQSVGQLYYCLQIEDDQERQQMLPQIHDQFHDQLFVLAGNRSLHQCRRTLAPLQSIITSVNATLKPNVHEHNFYTSHRTIVELLMARDESVVYFVRYHCINATVHDTLAAIQSNRVGK